MVNPFRKSPNHTTLLTKMSLGCYCVLGTFLALALVVWKRNRDCEEE